jgi:hypothetical protein
VELQPAASSASKFSVSSGILNSNFRQRPQKAATNLRRSRAGVPLERRPDECWTRIFIVRFALLRSPHARIRDTVSEEVFV